MDLYILLISFFVVALVYSSVGFGGGSSYLALLALVSVPFEIIRPTALLCNIIVVTSGTWIFYKENLLDLKKCWPLMVISVPMAFLGGYWPIKENTFFIILAIALIVAALVLWFQQNISSEKDRIKKNLAVDFAVGGSIGFLSGLVSIGGGIFLSPVLHFLHWDNAKKISAVASLFILVNSISGLAGQLLRSPELDWHFIFPLLIAVFAGGQIGSRLGARKFNLLYVKRITAVVILIAGLNILKDHLF